MYTPTTFQRRTSTFERDIVRPDGRKVASRVSIVTHYFGWKGGNYHKIIDPVVMYGKGLDDVWPTEVGGFNDPLVRLLRWAVTLQNFCQRVGVDVRPTIGGISSQFHTDFKFYPKARRKVPAKINERARERMPGNHYLLTVEPHKEEFTAYYLDQRRAHHYHASRIQFPASDTLYAYGRFTDLAECVYNIEQVYPHISGLYCLDLVRTTKHQPFSWLKRTIAQERAFVWSNELSHLLDSGWRVKGVRAVWGSRHRDTGINRYARWAESQLDKYEDAGWLKPLLLSAYGILAIRPRHAEAVFRLAKSGTEVTFRTGKHSMSGRLVRSQRKLEPNIANVLYRGMIEAATRSDSIGLAQYLSANGHHVLSIYADAVIVEVDDDLTLPLLPEPWRNKQTLNHLEFFSQQAFVSGEMTKLPGVGREILKRPLRSPAPEFTYIPMQQFIEGSFVTR